MVRSICLAVLVLALPHSAQAFCGFFVSGADAELVNDATQVALMRKGNRTVLSMSNTYQGPPENFAMVVPVPVVLQKEQVKTLNRNVFKALDQISAPRLVEYWERDPCEIAKGPLGLIGSMALGSGAVSANFSAGGGGLDLGVKVEAKFSAGEYEVVILSAKQANGLEAWLRHHNYNIPEGAAAALAPYVREGMKFFVAKVNIEKVIRDARGVVVLSPLRFDYESPTLRLPVRLGLLNAKGKQDLVIYVIHPTSRFEVANYENVFIPSNLEVENEVRERFGDFYAALFDTTLSKAKRPAVVTEYAWQTTSCDPCPRPPLTPEDLAALGGDLLNPRPFLLALAGVEGTPNTSSKGVKRVIQRAQGAVNRCHQRNFRADAMTEKGAKNTLKLSIAVAGSGQVNEVKVLASRGVSGLDCIKGRIKQFKFPPTADNEPATLEVKWVPSKTRSGPNFSQWVLTRLHTRYDDKTLSEDLVFVEGSPVRGGRGAGGINQETPGAVESSPVNQFQGRYIIRHYWEKEVTCESPQWGRWGGNPKGNGAKPKAIAGERLIGRSDTAIDMSKSVRSALPLLGFEGKSRPPQRHSPQSTRPKQQK